MNLITMSLQSGAIVQLHHKHLESYLCAEGVFTSGLTESGRPHTELGSYHFLPGGGASVCNGRSPIFFWSPFAYVNKFWSPPLTMWKNFGPHFGVVTKLWSPQGERTSPSTNNGGGSD